MEIEANRLPLVLEEATSELEDLAAGEDFFSTKILLLQVNTIL